MQIQKTAIFGSLVCLIFFIALFTANVIVWMILAIAAFVYGVLLIRIDRRERACAHKKK